MMSDSLTRSLVAVLEAFAEGDDALLISLFVRGIPMATLPGGKFGAVLSVGERGFKFEHAPGWPIGLSSALELMIAQRQPHERNRNAHMVKARDLDRLEVNGVRGIVEDDRICLVWVEGSG